MNIFGYDIQEGVVFIIRIIATIGGAVIGWFVCDPTTRGIYWLAKRAATPTALLFCTKTVGAMSLAAAVWILMPQGGGGSGPGFGPGPGGIPGKGGDKASDKATGEPAKDAKIEPKKDRTDTKDKTPLEPVEIEIISDSMYLKLKTDDKEPWYAIKGKAYTYDELDTYLRANRSKIEVTPVLTKHSIHLGRTELTDLTRKYGIKTLQFKTQ
ncbi:MAG TPA: hypothetical protein VFE62_28140 [Gemmataceae bacterium]|nr:hypothetical protein [Gemmataceae bacterium]